MAKLREGEKRVQLCFIRPEDVALYDFMEKQAYRCRWPIQTFILASLTEAFKEKMEEYEVEAIAQEAAQKVRERKEVMFDLPDSEKDKFVPEQREVVEIKGILQPVSMEDAAKQAEAQIAQLDAMASTIVAKRLSARKGGAVPPPPPPLPTSTTPAKRKRP